MGGPAGNCKGAVQNSCQSSCTLQKTTRETQRSSLLQGKQSLLVPSMSMPLNLVELASDQDGIGCGNQCTCLWGRQADGPTACKLELLLPCHKLQQALACCWWRREQALPWVDLKQVAPTLAPAGMGRAAPVQEQEGQAQAVRKATRECPTPNQEEHQWVEALSHCHIRTSA